MRRLIVLILVVLMLAGSVAGTLITYHVVDWQIYRRDTTELDLRGRQISVSHYDKLKEKLPDARIHWDVPFQGSTLPEETTRLTVTELSREDAQILAAYLPRLEKVEARGCTDYENLMLLAQLRPGIRVDYLVKLSGTGYAAATPEVKLENPGREDLQLLDYLPQLGKVIITGGQPEILEELGDYCRDRGLELAVRIQGEDWSASLTELDVTGITEQELPLLRLMPGLERVYLKEPQAPAQALLALREAWPGLDLRWEKTVLGMTFTDDAQTIDLTPVLSQTEGQEPGEKTNYQLCMEYPCLGTKEAEPASVKLQDQYPLPDRALETRDMIRELEAAMAYFPDAGKLLMLGCFLDNQKMDAFRTDHQGEYEVVWLVQCGKVGTRTDTVFFMPTKYRVYYFQDFESGNLRYLHDVVALDLGHMNITDVSFLEEMPDLEYLVLAHTSVRNIEPVGTCKKLKFLEVDWTGVQDLSPLEGCTALEDLNVGKTWCDLEPLKKLTWLKNLWMIGRNYNPELEAALPNTHVQVGGKATVAMGWREKPNYYAMRDLLKMDYMSQ